MPSDKVPGKSVFVGNIPYGVSEEQIIDIFSRVGHVVSFRLVHDKDTGRPKGFGFLEYSDVDTAAAAVRNLNDHDIMGRKLRVDWSNDGGSGGASNQHADLGGHNAPNGTADQNVLPPLPAGVESTNISAPDAISQTLAAMPAPQLLDLISQMKGMVAENPAQVAQLFQVAPQLAYAIFQALLLLGLTDTSVLSSIVQAAAPQSQPQQPIPQAQPLPPPPQSIAQAPNPYNSYPQFAQHGHMATPPVSQPAYQPPPQQPPQQPVLPPGQEQVIAQLMAMTRDQILALPSPQRDQVLQLRAQLGAPVS